jgi:hypothetical protein
VLVRSAIVALYPRTDGLPGVEDCDLDAFLARFRRDAPPLLRIGLVLGALVFHLTPLFTILVPLPAFMLSEAQLDKHAHAICTTDAYLLRQSVFLVRLVAGMCWGSHPSVRARFALAELPPDPGTWRTS